MKKSEFKNEISKTKIGILQKVGFTALLLMMVEIIVWNVKKMSITLLVAILLTCVVEVVVGLLSLKELGEQKKNRK